MPWIDFSNTAGWPSDGRGGLSATSTNYTTNGTVFTGNSVTGGTMLATLTNTAVGLVIATSDGFWGVITAFDAAPNPDIIYVDRWRKWGFPGSSGIPAADSDLTVFTTLYGAHSERWVIDALEIVKATAADTIAIRDIYGVAFKTWTVGATAGPLIIPYTRGTPPYEGPDGWEINGPFQVLTSAATTICTMHFRVISGK